MKKGLAFLVGLTIGAVVTALVTPKTGKELQDDLVKKANEVGKKIKEFDIKDINFADTKEALKCKLDDAKKAIEDFDWSESKEKVQKKFEEVTERLSEIKCQLANVTEEVEEAIEEVASEVEEATEEIADSLSEVKDQLLEGEEEGASGAEENFEERFKRRFDERFEEAGDEH